MFTLFTSNYEQTIFAVVVACALPILLSMLAKALGGFTFSDHNNPRVFLESTQGMAARANAAQQNGFEILPLFIASIFFGMYLVVPQSAINQLAWTFVFIRIAYSIAYILDKSILRSLLWFLSVACPLLIFKLCLVG